MSRHLQSYTKWISNGPRLSCLKQRTWHTNTFVKFSICLCSTHVPQRSWTQPLIKQRKQASRTTVTKSETVAKTLGKAISFWLPDWRLHYIIQILFNQICQHTFSYSANMSKIKWFEDSSAEYSNSWRSCWILNY